ncbi:RIP metalloprotease RseP [Chitinolyticbacter meiyuanensis]|uniref:RIP metalloprotease RseP n=1 Tax=Chitinolyticbacter meiyuanensis TaxID=682798 RepID=UPI0011E5EA25|nr:RIP metalloprotease RseP [Chitinolyticbacter meiyuanensis]
MLTLLAFVVTLGVLVTIHEYGHYWVAKRCGVKVLTFSIGFGKPLVKWQRGDTTWQLALLPLGGYVRMLDEREAAVPAAELARAFNRQHPLKKMAVVVAGPVANLILACGLYWGLGAWGVDALRPIASEIKPGSPAALAGMRSGDEILRVGEANIASWDRLFIALIDEAGGDGPVSVTVRREGEGERIIALPSVAVRDIDPQLLSRLGLSPVPMMLRVAQIVPGSAAAKAGMQLHDDLVAFNGVPLQSWSMFQSLVSAAADQRVNITVRRGDKLVELAVTPERTQVAGKPVGRLGVAPAVNEAAWEAQRFRLQYDLVDALGQGLDKAWTYARITLVMFGRMLIGQAPLDQISGPVTIAVYAGQSAEAGWTTYLDYLALISLSLAVLNLLPVPVLDGGHLLYHTAELLTGRPVPARVEEIGQRIGLVLLLALMALALFNDFNRFVPG